MAPKVAKARPKPKAKADAIMKRPAEYVDTPPETTTPPRQKKQKEMKKKQPDESRSGPGRKVPTTPRGAFEGSLQHAPLLRGEGSSKHINNYSIMQEVNDSVRAARSLDDDFSMRARRTGPTSLAEMYDWPWRAFTRLSQSEKNQFMKNVQHNGFRFFSQFAGMDCFSQAMIYIMQSLNEHGLSFPAEMFTTYEQTDIGALQRRFLAGWDGAARAEHIFGDIKDRVPQHVKDLQDEIKWPQKPLFGCSTEELAAYRAEVEKGVAATEKVLMRHDADVFKCKSTAHCFLHNRQCKVRPAKLVFDTVLDVDVAGTCCFDWSTAGRGAGLGGRSGQAFINWAYERQKRRSDLIVHECTKLFPVSLLRSYFPESEYTMVHGILNPHDMGQPCSRQRSITYLLAKQKYIMTSDIDEFKCFYSATCRLNGHVYFASGPDAVQQALGAIAKTRSVYPIPGSEMSWEWLLHPRERVSLAALQEKSDQKRMMSGLVRSHTHGLLGRVPTERNHDLLQEKYGPDDFGPEAVEARSVKDALDEVDVPYAEAQPLAQRPEHLQEKDFLYDLSSNGWVVARTGGANMFCLMTGTRIWNDRLRRFPTAEEVMAVQMVPSFGPDKCSNLRCPFLHLIPKLTYRQGMVLAGNSLNVALIGTFLIWAFANTVNREQWEDCHDMMSRSVSQLRKQRCKQRSRARCLGLQPGDEVDLEFSTSRKATPPSYLELDPDELAEKSGDDSDSSDHLDQSPTFKTRKARKSANPATYPSPPPLQLQPLAKASLGKSSSSSAGQVVIVADSVD